MAKDSYPRGDALLEVEDLLPLVQSRDPRLVVIQAVPAWMHWMQHVPGSRQVWRHQLERPPRSLLIALWVTRWWMPLACGGLSITTERPMFRC